MKWTIVAMLACAGVAAADPIPMRARALAERGRAAHDAHDYAGAIAAFTEAYALAPAPALLFNLAQAYRLAGRCDDAAVMYRRFLASSPPDDARQLAEQHLATVDRCAKDLTVIPDRTIVRVTLPPAPPPERPRHDHHWSTPKKTGVGLAIGGGVALAIAGFYALDAHQTSNEVERRYAAGEKWNKLAPLDAEGRRQQTYAEVAGVTGVVLAGAAATILVVDHNRHKRRLDVAPLSSRGARVSLAWQF